MKLTARAAREPRRRRRRRLHRLLDLEVRRDVPAGDRGDGRRRLPRLRRPLEPDPRRVRRVRGAVRPRGAPRRRSPTTTGRPSRRMEAIGHREAFGLNWDPQPLRVAGPRPGRASCGTSRTGSTTSTARTRSVRSATAATAGWARTCRGPTRAAAGTSSPPATATCRGSSASGCSTRSATTARSRSSGRTPAWTGSSVRPRRWSSSAGSRSTPPTAAFDAAFSAPRLTGATTSARHALVTIQRCLPTCRTLVKPSRSKVASDPWYMKLADTASERLGVALDGPAAEVCDQVQGTGQPGGNTPCRRCPLPT